MGHLARPLVIGNGRLLICFDEQLAMRDFYYPHVGQVNHIVGDRNRLGIWADGAFGWVGERGWDLRINYRPDSLVGETTARSDRLGLELTILDGVHPQADIFLRRVHVRNLHDQAREVRLYAPFDFDLDETDVGDTAIWDPHLAAMIHYKRNRWMLIGAEGPVGGIHEYATGRKRFQGAEGTWRDAEDGQLEGHPISQGAVDSTIGLRVPLEARAEADLCLWVVCGSDRRSVAAGQAFVRETGPEALLDEVETYWRTWAHRGPDAVEHLPADLQEAYRRSLLIIRTQVDDGGAILAANDSDILAYNRDHYSYMWPRDGAFVAGTLDRAGCGSVTRRFYGFCRRAISEDGYFWHKYNPDGSVGSSWHPWVGAKGLQLPIQEDETALVLWSLGQYYGLTDDHEFIGGLYRPLVVPAAEFLLRYRDERTGLPLESFDLWEERRGVFTFTVATVIAGLRAAGAIADALGDQAGAVRYAQGAASVQEALLAHLWSEERGYFLRGAYFRSDGTLLPDETLESSVMGLFLLDILPVDDLRLESTMRKLHEGLWAKTEIGGIARYYNDYYFRVGDDPEVTPGNPWIICTLWLARWQIARAKSMAELEEPVRLIRWALQRALPTGALPEQVNPFTGAPLSVLPLTWSHAVMVDTLLDLGERLREV